jgi:hypothetical protein
VTWAELLELETTTFAAAAAAAAAKAAVDDTTADEAAAPKVGPAKGCHDGTKKGGTPY